MTEIPAFETPHRRFDPLSGRWVLVSAHRAKRPWQGSVEQVRTEARPRQDPACYLCPGSARAGGDVNPEYEGTFVFRNDFSALLEEPEHLAVEASPLFSAQRLRGTSRVICFSPRHDLSLAEMDEDAFGRVIETWMSQTAELGAEHRWVQVFENKGEAMGASNPHPHGQIWAGSAVPTEVAAEDRTQAAYLAEHGSTLLADYTEAEIEAEDRLVYANDDWAVLVPYWAVWPFEALVVARRPVRRLPDLDGDQRSGLAGALRDLLVRYDNLFETPFPYSMGWHGAPFDDNPTDHWQLHAHAYPPLLRSATVRKFMVGYELLAEAQRDLTPEQAAERLRQTATEHYLGATNEQTDDR